MAEPLKNFFGPEVPARIAGMISGVHPTFNSAAFVADACAGLDALELLPRGWHIADALQRHLPADFPAAAAVLKASLEPRQPPAEGGMASFLYLPHTFFVARYGLDHLEPSLELQYELTKRFTAEFSIRAFIDRYPEQVLAKLREWARDPDVHVRRLVSEGTRPRLPWAPRLRAFQEDPRPVLELLELLRDDPELYVRRSVANHLNDIGKDHPELLFDVCKRWLVDATPEREWLVRHALRSAVKRGERGALDLLGYGRAPAVRVDNLRITPARAMIGDNVDLAFEVANTARRRQSLLIDFRVHFVKAGGGTSPKVFKLTTVELAPGESVPLRKKISLRQMTTRKHYPGEHRVDVLVNGVAFPAGEFLITQ